MKKNILSLAALLIASAAVFTACSSDDNNVADQGTKTYTLAVQATKGDDASTRALSLEGKTLNATWATTENVYVKKGDNWATGSLQPEADGVTATLKGTLSDIEINADDELTLQFPKSGAISYDGQVGTLDDIAANFDYATADVTVASVSASGNIVPKEATTTFENQQAIVKFTLTDKETGSDINTTNLVISVGTTDYTINPTEATNVIYAAIPGFEGQTVKLTATVDEDTYFYEKTGVSFTNGKYYEIGVKMTKAAVAEGHALSASAVGEIVGTDGLAYAAADKDNLPTGVTAAAMVAYKSGSNGLAIALADEASTMDWSTANSVSGAIAHTPTVTGDYSWKLPSQDEWKQMFSANGGNEGSYSGLNSAITTAGGSALQNSIECMHWSSSSSEQNEFLANAVFFNGGSTNWYGHTKSMSYKVRAVLAFTIESSDSPTYTLLSAATTADYGKVVCANGHLHKAKTAVPDGCTAVGILGKVTETGHGLILALKDATSQNWSTINGWTSVTTYAGTTLQVLPDDAAARGTNLTSYTMLGATAVSNWAVAQKDDYVAIFTNLGSTTGGFLYKTYDINVNAYINTGVGGTGLSSDYWSATEFNDNDAWRFNNSSWMPAPKDNPDLSPFNIRPVLGF